MADNSSLPVASGNETFANKDLAGVKYPKVILFDTAGVEVMGLVGAAAVITNVSGTILGFLRGIVALLAAGINVAVTNANANFEVAGTTGSVSHQGAPTVNLDPYSQGKAAPVSATTLMGAAGAQYDYLAGVLIIPTSTSPGAVSFTDGNGSAQTIFAGGASSVGDLRPFTVPLGIYALVATTPGFRLTCGAAVSAFGIGKFT